ncbi:MAG: transglycosylase family protein [Desertimonas sp.]
MSSPVARFGRVGALAALAAIPLLGACTPQDFVAWRTGLPGGVAAGGDAQPAAWTVWDDLAECESGGDWAIDTGNGYHGGLQFAAGTWRGFGGQEFAATAAGATREQQIVVAERVRDEQGWGAWPSCARQLGLR